MLEVIINYWVAAAMGGVATLLGILWGRFKEQKLLKAGVLAILHDRLYQGCRFFIAQGYIDIEGLKNIEYMYRSYHALGGNGTGTELFERVKKLPIRED